MSEIPSPRGHDTQTLPKDLQQRIHLRYAGRRLKLMGDLFLMAGAYNDAVSSFAAAVDETKSVNDSFWNLAAQGQLYLALALQQHHQDVWLALPGKWRDLVTKYEQIQAPRLAFELLCQIALLQDLLGLREVCSSLSTAWLVSKPMVVHEKLSILARLISLCGRFGFCRKAEFYRKKLVHLLINLEKIPIASSIFQITLTKQNHSWLALKKVILDQAMELSRSLHDSDQWLKLAVTQLFESRDLLSVIDQENLNDRARTISRKLRSTSDPSDLPFSHLFDCKCLVEGGIKVAPKSSPERSKSPMIYTPFSRQQKANKPGKVELFAVANEPLKIQVKLRNPLLVKLLIDRVNLVCDSADCYPVNNVTLEPEEEFTLNMFIVPREPSIISLEKVELSLFSSLFIMSNPLSHSITVLEPQPLLQLKSVPQFIQLLEGEQRKVELSMVTLNSIPVQHLKVLASTNYELDEQSITLLLVGIIGVEEVSVTIQYGTDRKEDQIVRALEAKIRLSTRPSLSIKSIAFVPAGEPESFFVIADISNESPENITVLLHDYCKPIVPGQTSRIILKHPKIDPSSIEIGEEALVELRKSGDLDDKEVAQFKVRHALLKDVLVFPWSTEDGKKGFLKVEELPSSISNDMLENVTAPKYKVRREYESEGEWRSLPHDFTTDSVQSFFSIRYTSEAGVKLNLTWSIEGYPNDDVRLVEEYVLVDGSPSGVGNVQVRLLPLSPHPLLLCLREASGGSLLDQHRIEFTPI